MKKNSNSFYKKKKKKIQLNSIHYGKCIMLILRFTLNLDNCQPNYNSLSII
jgi:hypothetical protein